MLRWDGNHHLKDAGLSHPWKFREVIRIVSFAFFWKWNHQEITMNDSRAFWYHRITMQTRYKERTYAGPVGILVPMIWSRDQSILCEFRNVDIERTQEMNGHGNGIQKRSIWAGYVNRTRNSNTGSGLGTNCFNKYLGNITELKNTENECNLRQMSW